MEALRETTVVQALLRPPLFFGVPRWFLSVELVVVACAWMGAQVHWSSFVVTTVVFILVHPVVAWKSRENPWAVAMFLAYLRRPVLYSNRAMLRAPARRPFRTLP
ncbi:MAG TPA: VirB3 family type IV secretion system protein [Longimicrobiaceae bacterium]|nr:VirB3 family type IV secretion system protein [Longimicrobiaceae bacterium]